MKIIPDIKATFGDTYFLGYTVKKKFDITANRKTEEPESYLCKISSSELKGQIEVIVPLTVAVDEIGFNQKVIMQGVIIDPYARSSEGTSFAQVVLRCMAQTLTTAQPIKTATERNTGQK